MSTQAACSYSLRRQRLVRPECIPRDYGADDDRRQWLKILRNTNGPVYLGAIIHVVACTGIAFTAGDMANEFDCEAKPGAP